MTDLSESVKGGRHSGREVALQVLYALDLGETGPRDARAAREAKAAKMPAARHAMPPAVSEPTPPSGPAALTGAVSPTGPAAHSHRPPAAPEREDEAAEPVVVFDPVEASGTAFDRITEHFSVPGSSIDFARELVGGVAARAVELDEIVGQHARNWRVSRMAAVDRNVLRLAVYELRDTDTPIAVVIDEAVDLARRFGSDTSPSFVNGILDAVAREVRVV